MRISLERLDARGLGVDLPGTGGERIVVASAAGLRGIVEQEGGRLALSGVAAEALALASLRVLLGEVTLSSDGGVALEGLALSLEQGDGRLALQVTATSIGARDLTVAVGEVVVSGRVVLDGARLVVDGDEGSLAAERMVVSEFRLRIGELETTADALTGTRVAIRWGRAGFAMSADGVLAPSLALALATKGVRCAAQDVAVTAFALDDRHVAIGRVALGGGHVGMTFASAASASVPAATSSSASSASSAPAAPAAAPRSARPPADPLVDWHVLDYLSGEVDVDVDLDLTVPILGSRKATHRLRVPIAGGSIDYRALESNLSALENAILDFSVRDGALVLERVNPLFPARGHGKPVVVWDLDAADLAVAETNRVRLAVLPHARVVGSEGADDDAPKRQTEPSRSAVALRKVGLHRIDVRLALAPVEGPLTGAFRPRGVGSFVLQGSVFHHPGAAPREGSLLGEIAAAAMSVTHFQSGTTVIDIARADFVSIAPIEVAFLDVHPTKVELGLSGAVLDSVVITMR